MGAAMRNLEAIGYDRFKTSVSYPFVIAPTGEVGEGAGWTRGSHTARRNSTATAIAFIGNFENDSPTPEAMDAFVTLVLRSIKSGHLVEDVAIQGDRDVSATLCPGENLYAMLPELRTRIAEGVSPTPPLPLPPYDGPKAVLVTLSPLRKGDEGGEVESLQVLLKAKAYQNIQVDGDFGPVTANAVKNVQRFYRMVPTGIMDAKTWGLLFL